jgi:hypothetical protein
MEPNSKNQTNGAILNSENEGERVVDALSKLSEFDQMKFVREEIRFEHTVLGNRISAYLASQAFLMTTFAISARTEHRASLDMVVFSFFGIPILGILITYYICLAVAETVSRITKQRELIYTKDRPLYSITQKLRPENGHSKHNMSLLYATNLTIIFGLVWCLIFLWGLGVLAIQPRIVPPPKQSLPEPIQIPSNPI